MKKTITLVAIIIAAVLMCAFFVSCNNDSNDEDIDSGIGTGNDDGDKAENSKKDDVADMVNKYGKITDEEAEERKKYGVRKASYGEMLSYDNLYIYVKLGTYDGNIVTSFGEDQDIRFFDVTYMTEKPMSAFLDSVGGKPLEVDSFFINAIMVDEYATENNGGFPVLILFMSAYRGDDDLTGFYSYNMNTRELKLCYHLTGDERNAEEIALYGDRIYFSYSNGDKGEIFCSVRLDGTEKKQVSEELKFVPWIIDINDEYIFFNPSTGGTIYRCDTNFENIEKFAQTYSDGCIHDGYFYYASSSLKEDKIYDGETVTLRAIVRKALDAGLDDPEEFVYEQSNRAYYEGGKVYIQDSDPNHSNRIIKLDLDTFETETAFEYTEDNENKISIKEIYGNSWLIDMDIYEEGEKMGYKYAYYNLENKIWQEFDMDLMYS